MTTFKYLSAAAAIAVFAAGCESTPKQIPELDAARAEVRQATSDPLAQEAAGVRLKKAEAALRIADDSFRQHKPAADVRQQAYLATRHAQIAMEQTSELRARKEIEQGQAERNRVLLEARTSEAALAEAAAARAQTAAAQARTDASTAQNDTLRAQADAERSKNDAERSKNDADRSKSEAADQAAQALAARDKLAAAADESARLRSELEALQAKPTERGMVLTLGDVLFDTGQAVLRPGATQTVDRLAAFLHNRAAFSVLVEGHTDSVGADDYNMALSQRRADAVSGALLARGVAVERVRSHGLGKNYPNASNANASGRQQNRRVEIIFSDDKGKFMPGAERLSAQ